MSLKFYIIFASVLLIAFSAWSAPVADKNANSGFVEMSSLKPNATRRDAHPNPESSSGFYNMADLKNKRETSENEINELSRRDDADMQKLSKRALFYFGGVYDVYSCCTAHCSLYNYCTFSNCASPSYCACFIA